MHPSAARVQDFLVQQGFSHVVVEVPESARTAEDAAQAIGCPVRQIVKSLVFRTQPEGQAILALVRGVDRVDEQRLGTAAQTTIVKADAAFVREWTGFAVGGVPPVGHSRPLRTYIDARLFEEPQLWAAAGHPHAVFCLSPRELQTMTGGIVVNLAS